MRTGFLLIAIGIIALLFTSCEKDEMGDGGLGGGGKDDTIQSKMSSRSEPLSTYQERNNS
ncbi:MULTISPECIES: hypothetical protein [unclassified Dysgonomonas]|uniref:hypothetical protein n=1 Tax=unclassified Dysgonomonas TaxID=2630389 RepID=UPI00068325CA|nr:MULTISPECIES: hypothetical protein [unclassified Dysgonomonas]MBD8347031.1 hypothetical protein [Dysgonomonas sp. HGC4]MBF0574780.1 hypothetical protein [Dysgonomonas sp. GY617]